MRSSWSGRTGLASRRLARPTAGGVEARERAIAWAQGVASDPNAVFLDTETTGLDSVAEIVDIAILDHEGIVLIDTLVRPVRSIPLVASGIHGIRDVDVRHAPTWDVVYADVARILEGRRVVVYNAPFDSRLVTQCCLQCAIPAPDLAWQCAMRAYAEFCAEPGQSGGFKWHKLERAASRFGVRPGGHRARADAEVCRSVVVGMAHGGTDIVEESERGA